MQTAEQLVRQFIIDNFLFGQDDGQFGNDDSFMDKGIIDSTGVLELVGFLESTYRIQILDHELNPDNLDSVNRIARFLRTKQATPA